MRHAAIKRSYLFGNKVTAIAAAAKGVVEWASNMKLDPVR